MALRTNHIICNLQYAMALSRLQAPLHKTGNPVSEKLLSDDFLTNFAFLSRAGQLMRPGGGGLQSMTAREMKARTADVLARNTQRYAALQSCDVESLKSILGDDFLYVHATGRIDNKQDLIERVDLGDIRYLQIDRQLISAKLLQSDLCRIFERVQLRVETVRGITDYNSLVISHWSLSDAWQARSIQSTACPDGQGESLGAHKGNML